ncbi:MAG: hypothetical protein KA204_09815 [Chromatiaceae bacterium]|nr:hypothetical protein [Chromatiaceae bacterium]MBP8289953.1 hypothetical protein [Chromatiaceae bacterium]
MKSLFRLAMASAPARSVPETRTRFQDEAHRVDMAVAFGKNQLERGHPLTL